MNSKPLVVVLLLAIAGIAGWLSFRGLEQGPAPLPSGGVAPAAGVGEAATPAAAPLAPSAQAATADLQRQAVATPATAPGSVGAGGPGVVVRGRVVDGTGAPRAGCELTLNTWVTPENIEFDFGSGDEGPARAADRPKWSTRTDGTFELPLARDRSGELVLLSSELVFANAEPRVRGSKGDQDLGDVVVLRAGSIAGVVHDQNGAPVAGVKVGHGLMMFEGNTVVTTADGSFRIGNLRPGKTSLRTASGKFLPATAEIELAAEQQVTDLVLVVRPGNAIAGQVVDDRGRGVAAIKVGSKRKQALGGMDIERFTPDEAATTDDNGYFTLSGLDDEVVSVRAFGKGYTAAVANEVAVGTGDLLLRVERLGVVEGVLLDTAGAAVVGSRVSIGAPAEDGGLEVVLEDLEGLPMPSGQGRAVTAADGTFRIEGVRPGLVTVAASGKGHRPARQEGVQVLAAETTKGVRLVVERGAAAKVMVTDDQGKPVAGAKVAVKKPAAGPGSGSVGFVRAVSIGEGDGGPVMLGDDRPLGAAVTDAEGLAVVTGLPAGDLEVSASHAEFAPAVPARVALAKTGVVEAALRLRTPGFVEVLTLGSDGAPAPGVELSVLSVGAPRGGEGKRGTSDERGQLRMGPLAPGEYQVELTRKPNVTHVAGGMQFSAAGGGTLASSRQRFTVQAGKTTQVEVRRPVLTRVFGTVNGVDGPVAGCVIELEARQTAGAAGLPGFGAEQSVRSAADGSFELSDVEAGSYTLRYGKEAQVVKASVELEIPTAVAELRQDLALRTGKLRVAVVSHDGQPVAGAEVEVVRAEKAKAGEPVRRERRVMMMTMSMVSGGEDGDETTTMTMGAQRARTGADGIAEIDDVPVGDWRIEIRHKKFAPGRTADQVVVERQLTDCGRVELQQAGAVRGKVLGGDGKPVRMALVENRRLGTTEWSEPEFAQNGNYRLQGLAAGKYQLRARSVGMGDGVTSPEVDVEVIGAQTTTIDLQLPPK
jgi:protocatechuate 3,4-dioxygenase beta subunit